jgi:acetate kinase
MSDAIVVINAGSSSLKFSSFHARGDDLELCSRGHIEGIGTAPHFVAKRVKRAKQANSLGATEKSWPAGTTLGHDGALDYVIAFLRHEVADDRLVGVGHRVVHGGIDYARPVTIDAAVLAALERLVSLAPLHQPHNLAPIRRLLTRAPDLRQVACFDTAFHRTNPDLAQRFALPEKFHDAGVRRYGFHGLSYEYIASTLASYDENSAAGKTVVMHLGNGASMCAMEHGRSVATTMGFTAVDGLPMGTRCGSIDPGVLLHLMDQWHMTARDLERVIYQESGLLGVSGISSDMRTLLASSDPRARLAIDLYCYRIGRELGSLAAALGGLDAIVFTGGIGENAAAIRERVCRDAAWLGVEIDVVANPAGGPLISAPGARTAAWSIPTNEELMIARHTQRLLG